EDTAGVQAKSVVDPLGLVDGRVSVDHRGLASVVTGPGQTYRSPVLVGLPRGVSVQGEGAHPPGGPHVVLLLQPGVGHDEVAVVEHEVTDQPVTEGKDLLPEGVGFLVELLQGFAEAVADPDRGAL